MRKPFYILIALVLVLFYVVGSTSSVCKRTLAYSVGTFDERFGIAEEKFIQTIKDAEDIWEQGTGFDLFVYDPTARFTINLVFDERQEKTLESQKLEGGLGVLQSSLSVVAEKYDAHLAQYNEKESVYNANVRALEDLLAKHNKEVDFWNKKGGAPEKKYAELKAQSAQLETMRQELLREQNILEEARLVLNALADQNNALAKQYNSNVVTYNDLFGGAHDFNQGNYNGKEINVYQFNQQADLRLVLAHEIGHALDLGHVENSTSVMYYLMKDQNLNDAKLSAEDVAALTEQCASRNYTDIIRL